MASIGNWGSAIKFSVTSSKILTFKNMKRTAGGRWAVHNILGKKPKSEFQGAELQSVTMEIVLDARWGVKPRTTMATLRTAAQAGQVEYLYIKGSKICNNKMYIESMTESWDEIWSNGELVRASVELTFTEYV